MTLFRQIAIMLSVFLIILLTTVLILNFKSANESVTDRLYEDAKNTATSLSLSLGSANGDISMMSTMINANFDSGSYRYISLIDIEDKLLYERKNEVNNMDIPSWFFNTIFIEAPVASANVSAGWNPIGILNVQSDVSYAYTQLYTILKSLLVSFSILASIGLVTLYLLLIIILRPLKKVQHQAEAVVRNEFIIEDTNIYTKEFRDVVIGMNTMVLKAKVMFDKGNRDFKKQQELEYTDKVTQLKNRKYLTYKLAEYLKMDATSEGGLNIIIELSGIAQANEMIGRSSVNELFMEIASILINHSSKYKNSIVTRMNSKEFSILLPECSNEKGIEMVNSIYNYAKEIIEAYRLDSTKIYLTLGLCEYNYKDRIGVLLARADSALTHAKYLRNNTYLQKVNTTPEIMSKVEWKIVINKAIENNSFNFVPLSVVDVKNKKIVHNFLSLNLKADKETIYDYGQFMIQANQLGLNHKIYNNILSMMFKTPDITLKGSVCSLKLPYDYLELEETYEEMSKLFALYASKLPFKLIIEVVDKLVRKNSKEIKQYKILFEKYGINIGVREFIGESTDYQYLQDLRPVYIKGESNYFISQNNQTLSALRLITDTVGISLIATGVKDIKTLEKLSKQDIYILQGDVTEMLELDFS